MLLMKIESEKKLRDLGDVTQSVFEQFRDLNISKPIILYNCRDLGEEFESALSEKFEVNNYDVSISFGDSSAEGYCIDVGNLISCYHLNK